ncbi:MAG TPA: M20/M25/M40 family metallo-hydrolase, partial [Candidatus Acidoferrales bacterium]|nr:M20/M25/M40 family metallo-hydrolase [Candidatus Acidoferrales bacterium]
QAQTVPPQAMPSGSAPGGSQDLSQLESDSINWLQQLIRINTTNPPGNELVAAKYLAGILDEEGIHSEIFESTPGRGFLVARLSSSATPDPSKALLLMGHLDVVGVDKSKWTVDPFGGVAKDNYIYGRGAIDDKSMTIADLAVMIALKRSGVRLNRDVIFLAEGDEENGGETGMKFAVEKHWDKIACGFALNEDGEVSVKDGKVQFVGIQTSEKTALSVDVLAKGTSGHASVPRKDNPVAHLVTAMAKIAAYETPVQFNSVTRAYFSGLAPIEDEDTSKWMRALDTSDRGDHAARYISDANPVWNAMLRDTIVPTMLQAGIRQNVIPPEAHGVLNIRLLPGNMASPLVAKLQNLINDPEVRLEIEPNAGEAAPSSSTTSELYNTISQVAKQQFPGAVVVPDMSTSATDSIPLRLRSVQAYGMLPFPITEEDRGRMHSDDERIPVDSFRKGIEFLYTIVSDFSTTK